MIGVEPATADDAQRSLLLGTLQSANDPPTIADGLRTSLGPKAFSVLQRHLHNVVTSTDAATLSAMRFVWERLKIIIEPSSAVAVSPIFHGDLSVKGLRVGIILSGGNVDLDPMFAALAKQWLH